MFRRLQGECPMVDGRDTWWHDEMDAVSAECDCEWMDSESPLFMLYTSGSTGTPKGILHSTAGYMLGAWASFRYTFDYKPGEVLVHRRTSAGSRGTPTSCTARCWRATSVMFEGVPTFRTRGGAGPSARSTR